MKTEKKPKKGLTVGRCVNRARRYISKYGVCLLWFDVVGSTKFPERQKLYYRMKAMMRDLNSKFSDYFPKNDLDIIGKIEKGFEILWRGDESCAGINDAEIIREIIKYQKEKYPDMPLYWGVAKDGYEKKDWD